MPDIFTLSPFQSVAALVLSAALLVAAWLVWGFAEAYGCRPDKSKKINE